MAVEDLFLRAVVALESLARAFGRSDTDPRGPPHPPWPNVPAPTPVLPGPVQPAPAPIPGDPRFDFAFNWNTPGSYRVFYGGQTKHLPVPEGYNGRIRLEVTGYSGNSADFVNVIVFDGARVIEDEKIGTAGGNVQWDAIGGRSYAITVEGQGAVVSLNLLIGG